MNHISIIHDYQNYLCVIIPCIFCYKYLIYSNLKFPNNLLSIIFA